MAEQDDKNMLKKTLVLFIGVCMLFTAVCPAGVYAINYPISNGSSKQTTVYLDSYSDIGINLKFAQWSYSEWAKPTEDEVKCLHFNQTEYTAPFADVFFNSQILDEQYVYQADIYPVSTETSRFILGEATDNNKKYSYLMALDKDGFISVNGQQIKKIPYDDWTTVAIAVDTSTGLGDIYINNKLEKTDLPLHNGGVYEPVYIRIGFDRAATRGHNEAYVNAVKLYSGNELRIFDDTAKKKALSDGSYYYTGENEELAKEILDGDAVFMTTADSYFLTGEKKYYDDNKKPYTANDNVLMLPSDHISKALGVDIICSDNKITANGVEFLVGSSISGEIKLDSSPSVKNGIYYIPVYSFVKNVLGKYAYYDDRGFVIISNSQRNYSNSDDPAANEEYSDIVYRYMQFERPSGDKLFEDVIKHSGSTYPRMFIKPHEIEELRKSTETNLWLSQEKKRLINSCELHVSYEVEPYEFDYSEGQRLFTPFLVIRQRIFDLAVGYYLTGNEKYLERMWLECENVLSWPHWNFPENGGSFLDSGNVGPAMALAWDTLYNWMDDEQKEFFINKIDEKYLSYLADAFEGKKKISPDDARLKHSNWGAVTMSGAFLCAMSFLDNSLNNDEFIEKCKFIASSSLKMLEYPMGSMYPDGAIIEGLGYWTYYVEGLSWSANAMVNMCGEDYGFLTSKGYREAIDYGLNIQTSNGSYNYATTTTEGVIAVPELFLVAKLYDDRGAMDSIKEFYELTGQHLGSRGLLFYREYPQNDDYALSLDNLFEGLQIATMRSSYDDKNSAYVGILGGTNTTSSHFDKGSFIFDLGGVRWISDLGGEIKDVYGGYYHAQGWNLYRKRTEGHNSLIINPYNNEKVTEFIQANTNTMGSHLVTTDDSYTGQSIGGRAEFIDFSSKDRAAMAVMDLSDVYGNSVKSYKRGYLLGDQRRSLIIRDELELTKDNSNLYWNLHTNGGEITVEGNTAYIEKQGKKLKIEILTDIKDFKLSKEAAEPLDSSMIRGVGVEGAVKEYSRDSYSKLVLSANASGRVYISAKLSLADDTDVTELQNTEISGWTLPDGEISRKAPKAGEDFKFTSPNVYTLSPKGEIMVSALVPYKPDVLKVFLDEKEVFRKESDFDKDGIEKFYINAQELKSVNAILRMEYIYSGASVSVEEDILVYKPIEKKELINTAFETLTTEDNAASVKEKIKNDLHLHFVDGYEVSGASGGGMEITFASSGELNAGYLNKTIQGSSREDVLHAKWTMSTQSYITMYIACEDMSGVNTNPAAIRNMPVEYGTNTYELFLDGKYYVYYIYDENENLIYNSSGQFISNSGGWGEFRLKFYSDIPKSSMIIKNVTLDLYSCERPFLSLKRTDEGLDIGISPSDTVLIYKVIYDDEWEYAQDVSIITQNNISIDAGDNCKLFVWNGLTLKPYCKPVISGGKDK